MAESLMEKIHGYVWCDREGMVHHDTLDPWDYGTSESEKDYLCNPEDHSHLFTPKEVK
jgi:hypothetical protein